LSVARREAPIRNYHTGSLQRRSDGHVKRLTNQQKPSVPSVSSVFPPCDSLFPSIWKPAVYSAAVDPEQARGLGDVAAGLVEGALNQDLFSGIQV
jgi:hypothetical protein